MNRPSPPWIKRESGLREKVVVAGCSAELMVHRFDWAGIDSKIVIVVRENGSAECAVLIRGVPEGPRQSLELFSMIPLAVVLGGMTPMFNRCDVFALSIYGMKHLEPSNVVSFQLPQKTPSHQSL